MKPARQKTSVRMKEARERLDAFEDDEILAEPADRTPNPRASLIFWTLMVVVGLAIYAFAAWMQRP